MDDAAQSELREFPALLQKLAADQKTHAIYTLPSHQRSFPAYLTRITNLISIRQDLESIWNQLDAIKCAYDLIGQAIPPEVDDLRLQVGRLQHTQDQQFALVRDNQQILEGHPLTYWQTLGITDAQLQKHKLLYQILEDQQSQLLPP